MAAYHRDVDPIEELVAQAYEIFSETSVYEVIDKPREDAKLFLDKAYANPPEEMIDKYLLVIQRLKELTS